MLSNCTPQPQPADGESLLTCKSARWSVVTLFCCVLRRICICDTWPMRPYGFLDELVSLTPFQRRVAGRGGQSTRRHTGSTSAPPAPGGWKWPSQSRPQKAPAFTLCGDPFSSRRSRACCSAGGGTATAGTRSTGPGAPPPPGNEPSLLLNGPKIFSQCL